MKITFDSNAWEAVFSSKTEPSNLSVILRTSLTNGCLRGFLSEAAFRIEAISKKARAAYFAEPHTTTSGWSIPTASDPNFVPLFSFGPDDAFHPGIPLQQVSKLRLAATHGLRIIRALNWIGLPTPRELTEIMDYIAEPIEDRGSREQRQILAFHEIQKRGVGKAAFDARGGWRAPPTEPKEAREFAAACAEWADGELVAAHIAYGNDVICTNDFGIAAGQSVFNSENRAWLADVYGVRFATIAELAEETRAEER